MLIALPALAPRAQVLAAYIAALDSAAPPIPGFRTDSSDRTIGTFGAHRGVPAVERYVAYL
jgi:hypothetical protein